MMIVTCIAAANLSRIRGLALIAALFCPALGYAAIHVDGRLDETEWSAAHEFRDFLTMEPLTLGPPRVKTTAKLLALPEGLAVGFICEQPAEERRTRTPKPRDPTRMENDFVVFAVDFEGKGRTGYEFIVTASNAIRDSTITNEKNTNRDWDGAWQHAVVNERDRWTAELLIPWSVATLGGSKSGARDIAVYFQRWLYWRAEKYAFPNATADRERFLSDFHHMQVPAYPSRAFAVAPYVSANTDIANHSSNGSAGVDLFWKPRPEFELAATVHPDFGQVESDDLVINLTSIESFFTDKRPFFTSNQGIFDVRVADGTQSDGYAVYTRRIGGSVDNGTQAAAIEAAAKIVGNRGRLTYGFLGASEQDQGLSQGRDFAALRAVLPSAHGSIGFLGTFTRHPSLNREVSVGVLDGTMRPNDRWTVYGQMLGSEGMRTNNRNGLGGALRLIYADSTRKRVNFEAGALGRDLELNDLGFLARNNLAWFKSGIQFRQLGFAADSPVSYVTWTMNATAQRNEAGEALPTRLYLLRVATRKDNGERDLELTYDTAGRDDLLSRGHGSVQLTPRANLYLFERWPTRNGWRYQVGARLLQEGVNGVAFQPEAAMTWFVNEKVSVDADVTALWSPDWLVWQHDNVLGRFRRQQARVNVLGYWFPSARQELRVRAQWLTLSARACEPLQIAPGGGLAAIDEPLKDFSVARFGLQIRYRFELAPLSYFYLVYSRGGSEASDESSDSAFGLIGRATKQRSTEQILAKISYRF